jgi:hypothetical protein
MSRGLSVSRLINVQVNLSPLAAQFANFNALLIVGDSDVIDVNERIRSYNILSDVTADFGVDAPEYDAAALFFAQTPRPNQLYIGRWARTATAGRVNGGVLNAAEQLLATWTGIADGSFTIVVDGVTKTLTGLDFSDALNLNNVATVIDAALSGGSVTWNGQYFSVISGTTGASSTVGFATAGAVGTNIATMLKLTSVTASPAVVGIVAETAEECVAVLADQPTSWYGLTFASSVAPSDDDHMAVAAYIEAAGTSKIYGISTSDTQLLSSTVTDDIASRLSGAQYKRTFVQYSAVPFVAASFFGRAFTVNFEANNSTITLMYKQEPGVTPENLTPTQANTLMAKRCNFYVYYDNGTAILQNGLMSGPAFFDEIHGTDWLQNRIQTNVWNLLYTSPTKVPQTDAGNHLIATTIEADCAAGVNNGLLAPGVWNSAGFGAIEQGDYLPKGYYVYAPPIAQQAQADREARKSVPFQVAVKLAGAIHSVDVIVNVNR